MRILITGASGNIGRGIIPLLGPHHQLVLHDLNPIETDLPFFQGDIQAGLNLLPAAASCDVILHLPAWHGIHSRSKTEYDFWRLNVDGTHHLFQAAVQQKVAKVVFLSSMAWYGHYDKYGFTKVIGEELCEYFWRNHKIRYVALRPGDLTPWRSFTQYGLRLLYGGVDRRDVLDAVRLAVENDAVTNEAFRLQRPNVFGPDEVAAWDAQSAPQILDRHFPGGSELVRRFELNISRKPDLSDISRTIEGLSWRPQHHFLSFLKELSTLSPAAVAARTCDY